METRMNLTSKVLVFACSLAVLIAMATVGGLRLAYADPAAETKPAAPDTIVEGVGWKDVRVGMKREDLVKALMADYTIDVDHVIRHYDVTHKICPAMWVEGERTESMATSGSLMWIGPNSNEAGRSRFSSAWLLPNSACCRKV